MSYILIIQILSKKKKFVFPIVVFSIFSSVFSGLSIGLIIPLLEGNDRNIFSDTYFKFLDDFLQYGFGNTFQEKIMQISLFIIFLSFLEFLFSILIIRLAAQVEFILLNDFVDKILLKINKMKYKKFFSYSDGEIFTIATTDIYNVSSVATKFLISIQSFILIIIYFVVMFSVSPWLTFIAILFFIIISIIITGLLGRKSKKVNRKLAMLFLKINSELSYFIENYKKVIGLGVEDKFSKNLKVSYEEFILQRKRYTELVSYSLPINNMVNTISIAALLFFGSILFVNESNSWTIMLIPFLVLLFKILPMITSLNNLRVLVESNKPFINRVDEFLNDNSDNENDGKSKFVFNKSIVFENVTFNFGEKAVLNQISFAIEKNKINTIVGPSGVGKTTIIDLILKIYEPEEGQILIDDVNILDISKRELRENISFLPQDLLMLNKNISENINLYERNISEQELLEELKNINLDLNISDSLNPEKIGYGGINLSGGQKQKINILRTMLKDSGFIIFDEPTNNLDKESVELFINQLNSIRGQKTVLIITHSNILENISDLVFELKEGKLVKK